MRQNGAWCSILRVLWGRIVLSVKHRWSSIPGLLVAVTLTAGCPSDSGKAPSAPGSPEARADGWRQFGGPDGSFRTEGPPLAKAWPAAGPRLVWEREIGPGYSGVSIGDGIAVTQFLDGEEDVVIAMDAEDGTKLWTTRSAGRIRRENQTQFGKGPNATPLIFDGKVFALGYGGSFHALDLETGEKIWSKELVEEFGGEVLNFGSSASPIAVDGQVVVLVGGTRHAVAAFDPNRGTLTWASEPGGVSYATPVVLEIAGRRQLLYFSAEELIALDPTDGRRLWSYPVTNEYRNNATQPIWSPEDGILWVATQADGGTRGLRITAGLSPDSGTGSAAADDAGASERFRVEELWFNNRIKIHFWNALRIGHHVYASIGGQAYVLACVDIRTGEIVWKERGFSQANFVRSGDDTILLDENGELARVELSNALEGGLKVLSQVSLGDEVTWTAPTLVGTRLYVRDPKRIRVFDLG